MFGYVDEQGNPLNFGGNQRMVILGVPNQGNPQYQQQQQEEAKHTTKEMIYERHVANIRHMHAAARSSEIKVLLDGMNEIRSGLSGFKISEGDKGGEGRPPMDPSLDEINHGMLQKVYLSLSEKYLNYCSDMMKELQVDQTHNIFPATKKSKKKDESVS